jgi:hypothetical protein
MTESEMLDEIIAERIAALERPAFGMNRRGIPESARF